MANPAPVPAPAKPRSAPRKSSRAKWIVGSVVLVLVVGGVVAARTKKGDAGSIAVTTEKAVVKTITQVVTATGKVQPQKEVKIAPEVSGEIVALPFKEGASVKEGDLLVSIKPDNYRFQVEQQEASLAASKASLVDSKSRLARAEEDHERNVRLFAGALISDAEMTASKVARESAIASHESAVANVRRAEGSLSQAKDQLSKTTMYSPIDGKVSQLNNQVGERVAGTGSYGGAEIMRVADLDNMEIRVKVNENDIVNLKVGNRAVITIDAFPGRKFNGEVREIGNSAQAAAQGSDDVSNFQVKIGITDRGVAIRPGMSATADIETQTVENVVSVPIQSVTVRSEEGKTAEEVQAEKAKAAQEKSGKEADAASQKDQLRRERDQRQQVVFLRQGDIVKLQRVEAGIADSSAIEIKSGLKAGDEVVSGSYAAISRTLKDGAKIRIETPKKK